MIGVPCGWPPVGEENAAENLRRYRKYPDLVHRDAARVLAESADTLRYRETGTVRLGARHFPALDEALALLLDSKP